MLHHASLLGQALRRRRLYAARSAALQLLAGALLAAALPGCGDDETHSTPPEPPGLEAICNAGTSWADGTSAFREATIERGLGGIYGGRMSAVDFDGDGWPDLVIRRGDHNPDDFSPTPACCATEDCPDGTNCTLRRTWLLRNVDGSHFEDVTQASGLVRARGGDANIGRPGPVYAFGDVDNDGDLDAFTGISHVPDDPSAETSEIMLNQGDGTFALGPAESGLRVASQEAVSGASFVDYDRNGLLDLWVTQNTYDNSRKADGLYWGLGNGAFQNVSEATGVVSKGWNALADINAGLSHTVAWGAAACDLNGDGWPELLAPSYGRSPNHLWQAGGPAANFQYTNRSVDSGYAFDSRDDWSDNESARCWCTLHPDAEECAGVPAPMYIACASDSDAFRWNHDFDREAFRLGGNSGTTVCRDIDNDGDIDLLTSEIVHWDVGSSSDPSELLLNNGNADVGFERPGNDATGLTREHVGIDWNDGDITAASFDFDNDGWADIYIGSTDYPGAKGLLYRQISPGKFVAVPPMQGIEHNRSNGIAVADFDRDGDLDVVVGHSRARCGGADDCYPTQQVRFFENRMHELGTNFVQLTLSGGPGSNRSAIGARVTVTTDDGVSQTQEVGGGHGHYGMQDDLTLHFGLGAACSAQVHVQWPDANGSEQTLELLSGYRFTLTQGEEPQAVLAAATE